MTVPNGTLEELALGERLARGEVELPFGFSHRQRAFVRILGLLHTLESDDRATVLGWIRKQDVFCSVCGEIFDMCECE